jgi:hypothetical protein
MPRPADSGLGNHASTLASVLPGSTVGVTEVHSIGNWSPTGWRPPRLKMPADSADSLQEREGGPGMIGGLDWLGDGAAVVTKDGSTYGGGSSSRPRTPRRPSAKVALLSNLATLAGGSANGT